MTAMAINHPPAPARAPVCATAFALYCCTSPWYRYYHAGSVFPVGDDCGIHSAMNHKLLSPVVDHHLFGLPAKARTGVVADPARKKPLQ